MGKTTGMVVHFVIHYEGNTDAKEKIQALCYKGEWQKYKHFNIFCEWKDFSHNTDACNTLEKVQMLN